MKKSTKIISTAIAIVLVMSFMVVGILAATSATASITSSVSWSATAGLEFSFSGWTWQSKEHFDGGGFSYGGWNNASTHRMQDVIVNTTTTNATASGLQRNFNANFVDITNDGVNNPESLYYIFFFTAFDAPKAVNVEVTEAPQSTSSVKVEWLRGEWDSVTTTYEGINWDMYQDSDGYYDPFVTNLPTPFVVGNDGEIGKVLAMRLTILTPDQNVTNFDASLQFSFS